MKLRSAVTFLFVGIFVVIQSLVTPVAIALPLSSFSDVSNKVTQKLPERLPDVSTVTIGLQENLSGLLDKVDSSKATVSKIGQQMSAAAVNYGKEWGEAALEAGSTLEEKAISVSSSGLVAGHAALDTAISLSHSAKDGTVLLIQKGANKTSYAISELSKLTAEAFQNNAEPLLIEALKGIDTAGLENIIQTLKQENLGLNAEALAHKFINSKLNASFSDGDWQSVATSLAEMIYEIAGVYDLPLQDLSRKQEVLKITSLGLGSAHVVSQGLELASFAAGFAVPSNFIDMGRTGSNTIAKALMFWKVGEAACDYYESLSGNA
ncbi:MAG TPA: hypothetical protein V6D29_15720 [Leptolyngbyaceae cyanobacterium]